MPGDPNECRQHAKRCLELAASARTPQSKAHFRHLADTWSKLASDLETVKRLMDGLDGTPSDPSPGATKPPTEC